MSRILFITTKSYNPYNGYCHRTRHTLESLTASGYTIDLLAPNIATFPSITGIDFRHMHQPFFCRFLPETHAVQKFVLTIQLLFNAIILANRTTYTVIHGIDAGGVIAWLIGSITKTPFIFDQHATLAQTNVKGPRRIWLRFYNLLERKATKKAKTVISNDPSIITLLSQLNRRSRACIIPDIPSITEEVSLQARHFAEARYRSNDAQKIITCLGSTVGFQGLDLFFNAIPHVLMTIPNARFVVVGGNTQHIQQMQIVLEKANIQNAVCFPGHIDATELAALFAISNVLVSPRRNATTTPIYVLDYLSSRTPIVAVDTPANHTILSPNNALIMLATPESLADGIIHICRSPTFAVRLGQDGYDTLQRENRTIKAFRHSICHCYQYAQIAP